MLTSNRGQSAAVLLALAAVLAACGGGGATGGGTGSGAGAQNPPGQNATSPSPTQQPLMLKFGPPGADVTPNVPVGGSAVVSAVVRDANGLPMPNVLVTFTPPTVAALNPAIGTALTDANGVATITVEGLEPGAGALTATATIGSTQQTATLAFAVTPASATGAAAPLSGSVEFVAATKQTLNIAGTGSAATSDVSFRVRDQNGQPLANQTVTFTPTVTTGGLTLQPTSAVSDAQGIVRTTVTAGNAPTPVRINASTTVNGNPYAVQSLQLSVSSGNPTQKFFSVSATVLNVDGCDNDGAQTQINARAGDQFGNPVPDGTTINFVTEGGRVGASSIGSCQISNGACSVSLESQEFRPRSQLPAWNNCRVTVLAYAVGQETFTDLNSNYRYDAGEPFSDLFDAYVNAQPLMRAQFEPLTDTLIKFIDSGQAAPVADGKWGNAHVRGQVEIVFSGRSVLFCRAGYTVTTGSAHSCAPGSGNEIAALSLGSCVPNQPSSTTLQFSLTDQNGNPLAANSAIDVEPSTGITSGTLSPAAVPNTNRTDGTTHAVSVGYTPTTCGPAGSTSTVGSVRIKVTPAGSYEQGMTVPVTIRN